MFTLSTDRIAAVAAAAQTDPATVTRIALEYDWSNDTEHQSWLDVASVEDIASWLRPILHDEQTG